MEKAIFLDRSTEWPWRVAGYYRCCKLVGPIMRWNWLRARFKITFRPRRSSSAGAVDGLGTSRAWTCPSGCGGEGPSPLSLALRDTPSRIASGSLRGAGTGPPSGSLCCRGGPPLGARNAARNFILKCALIYCFAGLSILSGCSRSPVRRAEVPANVAFGELRGESARQQASIQKTQEALQVLREETTSLTTEKKALFEKLSLLQKKGLEEERRIGGLEAQLAAVEANLKRLERKSLDRGGEPAAPLKAVEKGAPGGKEKESRETASSKGPGASPEPGARSPLKAVSPKQEPPTGADTKRSSGTKEAKKEEDGSAARSLSQQVLGLLSSSLGKLMKGDGGLSFSEIAVLGSILLTLTGIGWAFLRLFRGKRLPGAPRAKTAAPSAGVNTPVTKRPAKVPKTKSPAKSFVPQPARETSDDDEQDHFASTQMIADAPEEEFASTQIISRGGKQQRVDKPGPPPSGELDPDQALLAELEELMGEKFETK